MTSRVAPHRKRSQDRRGKTSVAPGWQRSASIAQGSQAIATVDLQRLAGNRAVTRRLAPLSRASAGGVRSVQRKGGGGGGTATGVVGIPGGETSAPSDMTGNVAPGYRARTDGQNDTFDGRTVTERQATAESANQSGSASLTEQAPRDKSALP